ncbi:MAG: hypothetical protein ACYC4L_18035 [Chloroflexota bacterium]
MSDKASQEGRAGFTRLFVIVLAVVAASVLLALLVTLGALSFLVPVSSSVSY